MIIRVSIDNLVIVEHAEFTPGRGLTAVTGETGAGKTLLAGAIGLLFGADADANQVGAVRDHSWVEGEFEVPESFWSDPSVAALADLRPEPDATLVLARRVGSDGRTRALAWGRTVTKGDLAAAGSLLVASAGQHAQRRLMAPSYARTVLDSFGGEKHAQLTGSMASAWRELETARADRAAVQLESERLRTQGDQVLDDLQRIELVQPTLEDEAELVANRNRARHHAELHAAMAGSLQSLGGDGAGAVDALGQAYSGLHDVAHLDEQLASAAAVLLEAQALANDAASTLRGRLEDVVDAPAAIDEIEARLGAYDDLQRRFGGTTESVLANWQQLQSQADLLGDVDGALATADAAVAACATAATAAATALGAARRKGATRLGKLVSTELNELGMADSTFAVVVEEAQLGVHGSDRVAMLVAPNAKLEPRPISDVASGGELSRIALALHVASGAGEAGTMLFDEIDAGIGGHTAHTIAAKLRQLSATTQVICITHLPQVAARADTNVVITKQAGQTSLSTLHDEDAVLDELCRMIGADASDPAARDHARSLRGPRFDLTKPQPELTLLP